MTAEPSTGSASIRPAVTPATSLADRPALARIEELFRRPAIGLILLLFLTACSGPGYYLQAFSGQWKLLHARQDVQDLLDSPVTGAELSSRLKTANQILVFAGEVLDLPANGSYSSYVEINSNAIVFNVIATGEFSLQAKKSCFLVVGCLPYRGYFKRQKADQYAHSLRAKEMDVIVSPASAYSTLGWFRDPLISTMFSYSDTGLAAYLFHELAHQRLFKKGDGLFSESYASFVEELGVRLWLESNQHQDDLSQWLGLQAASKDFAELVQNVRSELIVVYSSGISDTEKRHRKAGIFNVFSQSYNQLRTEKWSGRDYFAAWLEGPVNNAMLSLFNTYSGSRCAFQNLLDLANGNVHEFHRLAAEKSKLRKNQRGSWLAQECASIASTSNL